MTFGIFETLGVLGTAGSTAYSMYKFGSHYGRKKMFYKIAKFILTNIFNEIKDIPKIRELRDELMKKFDKKTRKELKKFILDLADLEKKQKQYNFDAFFRENKEEILKNVESLKEYFIKRQIVEEFSLFVFSRLHDTHIDIEFYKELQNNLIDDCVLQVKISPAELIEAMEGVYEATAIIDGENFTQIHSNFLKNKKELLTILKMKSADEPNRNKRRFINYLQDNIEGMMLTKDMIKKGANLTTSEASANVQEALGSAAVSSQNSSASSNQSNFLNQLNKFKEQMKV